jgi:ribosomal protein L7Ae-like RNA K-turn-binding protein
MLSLLGIARRAARLSLGNDATMDSMRQGEARLVILASDLSPRTAKGIKDVAEQEEVAAVQIGATMDEISMALGKRTGIVAVNDAGFAKKMHALCTNEEEHTI